MFIQIAIFFSVGFLFYYKLLDKCLTCAFDDTITISDNTLHE